VTTPPPRLCIEAGEVELGRQVVLGPIDLVIEADTPVALTGPSGAGKTVLCLVLAGALPLTRGRRVLEQGGTTAAVSVGLVLQNHGLVSALTAQENVALPLQAQGLERSEISERVALALSAVGLAAEVGRPVDELSGGERQRVGVARAVAGDPTVLVADEPTAELDPDNRQRILALLTGTPGRLVVVASDDPEIVATFPRVLHLDGGRLATGGA
jgi:putative ABC transport system ATP-binding protein